MLGVNQTVVFSLQMVILGALIGTEDLGQIIFGALSRTKDGAGVALNFGCLCITYSNISRCNC